MIPVVDFFGHSVSRLLVGGNPFSGHSYISRELNEEMLDYHTAHTLVETLLAAEATGYNTCALLADDFTLRMLREYRNCGGRLQWIAQTHPSVRLDANLMGIMGQDPIAIFHQGTMTDNLVEAGRVDELRDNIKRIKDTGKPTGMATHVPETLMRAEDEDWGVDFYMACAHNLRRNKRYESSFITGKFHDLTFHDEDRAAMFDTIRQCPKPCIAFKVLSGGHLCQTSETIEEAFRQAYRGIKPGDLVVVGVFQKHKDQLGENAALVQRVLAESPRT